MDGVVAQARTVDGAGWVRVFIDTVVDIGDWAVSNAGVIALVGVGAAVAWGLWRLLTSP